MSQHIALTTLVVPDYDEAIAYFVGKLGFVLSQDKIISDGKRWVVVHPSESEMTGLLLAKAATTPQAAAIGNQTGGRVSFFLHTDNFTEDYAKYRTAGINFCEEPRHEAYGQVVVFQDIFGNKWDLVG